MALLILALLIARIIARANKYPNRARTQLSRDSLAEFLREAAVRAAPHKLMIEDQQVWVLLLWRESASSVDEV